MARSAKALLKAKIKKVANLLYSNFKFKEVNANKGQAFVCYESWGYNRIHFGPYRKTELKQYEALLKDLEKLLKAKLVQIKKYFKKR